MKPLSVATRAKFLACLTLGLSVSRACRESGVSRRTAYYWKSEDIEFSDAWEDAKTASIEDLEDHLRARATNPDDKASHLLLMFLLKKLDPSYKDSFKEPEKGGVKKAQEFEFDPQEIDAAITILNAAKARKSTKPEL